MEDLRGRNVLQTIYLCYVIAQESAQSIQFNSSVYVRMLVCMYMYDSLNFDYDYEYEYPARMVLYTPGGHPPALSGTAWL